MFYYYQLQRFDMMIINTSLIAAVLLMMHITLPVYGQSFVFRVLANKGDNKIKRSSGDLQKLKTGTFLNKGDQLIASADAYIGLVHKTGKTLEIRRKGTLKVEDMEKEVAAKTTSVSGRYMQYVMNRLGDDGVSDNYRKNSNVVGAAVRGSEADGIELILPVVEEKTITSYDQMMILRWIPEKGRDSLFADQSFIVSITNLLGDELFMEETSETTIAIDLSSLDNDTELFLVKVVTRSASEEELQSVVYGIEKSSLAAKSEEVRAELSRLKAELDLSRGIDRLMLAAFYEENQMILEAMRQYELVIKEHPDVEDYKEFYQEFLSKNQMLNIPQNSQ